MSEALSRIIFYVALAVLPVVLATFSGAESGNFISEFGKNCALTAFMILTLQVVMAARFKWIERAFGFDILIRFHRNMALVAVLLLVAHPLLLAAGGGGWHLLIGLKLPWYIWVGKATLVLLLVNAGLSIFQGSLNIKFERWRLIHDILGPLIIVMAFIHSWVAGTDLDVVSLRVLWSVMLLIAVSAYHYHVIQRPLRLRARPYKVVEVQPEADDVWTVKLAPPEGETIFPYLPGQFHFITFFRGEGLPIEEHHWTISSSPTQTDHVASTIKALGDFTDTIGETKPGDAAAVHGPFGRFSYTFHPEERDLVFLAGGIGITPLMSMLRHMRDREETRSVLLIYANREESDIIFREELARIEAGGHPQLKLVHVLETPGEGWQGETGFVDREKIERLCEGESAQQVFYVCGPPPMVRTILSTLKRMGVPDRQIRAEIFSFLD